MQARVSACAAAGASAAATRKGVAAAAGTATAATAAARAGAGARTRGTHACVARLPLALSAQPAASGAAAAFHARRSRCCCSSSSSSSTAASHASHASHALARPLLPLRSRPLLHRRSFSHSPNPSTTPAQSPSPASSLPHIEPLSLESILVLMPDRGLPLAPDGSPLAPSELPSSGSPSSKHVLPAASSVEPLWNEVAAACARPDAASRLTAGHISRLLTLAIHNRGPKPNRFLSLEHMIAMLNDAGCAHLLQPVYMEYLTRYADRLSFETLHSIAVDLAGCFPDTQSKLRVFQQVLDLISQHGRVQDVQRWLGITDSVGMHLDPSPAASEAVMDASLAADWSAQVDGRRLLALWHALKERGDLRGLLRHYQETDPARLNIYHYTTLLAACVDAKDGATFQSIWADLTSRIPIPPARAPIAPALSDKTDSPHTPHSPQQPQNVWLPTFNTLIRHRLATENLDAGFACFNQMREHGIEPTIREYILIISHLFDTERAQEAMQLFDRLRHSETAKPNAESFGIMISACVKRGLLLHAFKYYYALEESGLPYTVKLWGSLIHTFVQIKDMQTAERCFHDMLGNARFDPNDTIFGLMVCGYLEQKRYDKVLEFYELAVQWGCGLQNGYIQDALNRVYMATGEKPSIMLDLFNKFAKGVERDYEATRIPPKNLVSYYYPLVQYFARAREMQACETIVQHMQAVEVDPSCVYGPLVCGYSLVGEFETASKYAGMLWQSGKKLPVNVFNDMIVGAVHINKLDVARMVLDDLLWQGHELRPIVINAFLWHNLVRGSNYRDTMALMNQHNVTFNPRTFWLLMANLAYRARNFDEAWQVWIKYVNTYGPFDTTASSSSSNTADPAERRIPEWRMLKLAAQICGGFLRTEDAHTVLELARQTLPSRDYKLVHKTCLDAFRDTEKRLAKGIRVLASAEDQAAYNSSEAMPLE
ncbi:hypothetical protein BC831DRAFT_447393 [Entophlyctis helioformis]|nr:hypothetical protein BC831DRAFT_447393 [Entophlyctis helioformis]